MIIRHAESEGNAEGIMQGGGEYPLSLAGRDQATGVAEAIAALQPVLVVASHLSRAFDTARHAAGRVDRVDTRLRERGAGQWEGVQRAVIEEHYPGALDDDQLRPEGFEPRAEVASRMKDALADLLRDAEERDGVVLAVSHGAALRVLEIELGGDGGRFGHLEGIRVGVGNVLLGRCRFDAVA